MYLMFVKKEDVVILWEEFVKFVFKKVVGCVDVYKKKLVKEKDVVRKEEEEWLQRLKNLEDSKKIVFKQDELFFKVERIKLSQKDEGLIGKRVKVFGWIYRIRVQKVVMFLEIKDGYGKLQCIFFVGDLIRNYDVLLFVQEIVLVVYGLLKRVFEGVEVLDGRELYVDYFEVVGGVLSDLEVFSNKVSKDQDLWEVSMLDNRYLVLRGDNVSVVMKLREVIELVFVDSYREMEFIKVLFFVMVQIQVEGGFIFFGFFYYGEEVYFIQFFQLYFEIVIQLFGNVYCIEKFFRVEKLFICCYLFEYMYVEVEMDFIEFDDLFEYIEELICCVVDKVFVNFIFVVYFKFFNFGFQKLSRLFMWMRYVDVIDWFNVQEELIFNEEGKFYVFGDDIVEVVERKMMDIINWFIFLMYFFVEIKVFYMQKDFKDLRVMELVDVLMLGVGEIVGGLMRMFDYEELIEVYKKNDIGYEFYYWYVFLGWGVGEGQRMMMMLI